MPARLVGPSKGNQRLSHVWRREETMKSISLTSIILIILFSAIVVPAVATAQKQENEGASRTNPVPLINQPLVPDAIRPGRAGFMLAVNGTGFIPGSVVKWNGRARATTFVSGSRLTARILSSDILIPSTALVKVVNPGPGGGTSNVVFFDVTLPTSFISLNLTNFGAGSGPFSVATGDFNGDGKLDLAVANFASNNVSVLLGKGDGTFQAAADYSAGSSPQSVAIGDFNGDGKLDLAVANVGSNNVSLFLGNGDGTFQRAVNYDAGAASEPISVAIGDFNRDGKLDLVVADFNTNSVSVLLGKGDGTFQAAVEYSVGSNPRWVAVGDFNRDGKLDLVVANWFSSDVSIVLGKGDGTFQGAVNYDAGSAPYSVAVGDFNRDGELDLAVADVGSDSVSVLLGKGDGTFQAAVDYGAGGEPDNVAVGDFNGDGKLDLALANYGGNNVSVLLGNGDGTFKTHVEYASLQTPVQLAAGDFNRDGRLDLAVAVQGIGNGGGVSVLSQGTVASSKTSLNFPVQLVRTSSAAQTVIITNIGPLSLSISSIAITGTNATDFSQTNTCGTGLASGASCKIRAIFKPTNIGPRTAAITITDNAAGSPQSVALSGIGVVSGPNATLSPTSLSFSCGLACVPPPCHCMCTQPQTTTLSNFGSTMLNINSITIKGLFSQTNTCGTSLGPGKSCSITVSAVPARTKGVFPGTVSVSDNARGSPQMVTLTEHSTGCPLGLGAKR